MPPTETHRGAESAWDRPWLWVVFLTALVLAAKLPTLAVPYYWDEMGWAGQARWLSEGSLLRAFPGFRDAGAFQGRPPALFLTIAVLWRLTGHSAVVAHLLIAAFGAAGVCFTYLLGRRLYGGPTGLLAALMLLVTPFWFAQSGMFLADLPIAALGIATVYFALTGRLGLYLVTASYMVLVKETSAAIVVALLIYLAIVTPGRREKLAQVVRHAPPLLVLALFFGMQKAATGHYFITLARQGGDVFYFQQTAQRVIWITGWVFLDQGRFLLTGLIALHLVVRRKRGTEWLLYLLIVLLAGYSFSLLWRLPRYFLPVMPFLCLAGARAVMELAGTQLRQAVVAAVVMVCLSWPLLAPRRVGNGERDMTYLEVVEAHRETARAIEARFSGRRILTDFPFHGALRDPAMGYVTRPVAVVELDTTGQARTADLFLVPVAPHSGETLALLAIANTRRWQRIARWDQDGVVSELYGLAP